MTQATKTQQEAQYSKESKSNDSVVEEDGSIVIEINESEKDRVISGVDPENIERGPEQAVLSSDGGGDGDRADKRAGTFSRHVNGYSQQSHAWGSTFRPSDADKNQQFEHLKRVQNVGEHDWGEGGKLNSGVGLHTNQDARIFRRHRSICKGLELPMTIQQRAGRILGELREIPREVCHAWGSELTIAACIVKAVEEFNYNLDFDEIYNHLPKHPEREKEDARHRFEMAMEEIQSRHRLRNSNEDDAVIGNIRFLADVFDISSLTVEVAEGLYAALGYAPTEREEAHNYGKTEPSLAGAYVHAVSSKLRDADQELISSIRIADTLNLTSSAVSAPSKAIRETIDGTRMSGGLPALAGVKPFAHAGAEPTGDLIDELQRLADELGEIPTQDQMNKHGEYTHPTYQRRFGTWNDAIKGAGLVAK